MNVLFLDIDGVLVTMKSMYRETPVYHDWHRFSKESVDFLVETIKEYNFTVVLSSAWRIYEPSFRAVQELLNQFDLEIFDMTPDLEVYEDRYKEIEKWLSENPDTENYIILDDIPMDRLSDHWVRTTLESGLLPSHKQRIKEIMTA